MKPGMVAVIADSDGYTDCNNVLITLTSECPKNTLVFGYIEKDCLDFWIKVKAEVDSPRIKII